MFCSRARTCPALLALALFYPSPPGGHLSQVRRPSPGTQTRQTRRRWTASRHLKHRRRRTGSDENAQIRSLKEALAGAKRPGITNAPFRIPGSFLGSPTPRVGGRRLIRVSRGSCDEALEQRGVRMLLFGCKVRGQRSLITRKQPLRHGNGNVSSSRLSPSNSTQPTLGTDRSKRARLLSSWCSTCTRTCTSQLLSEPGFHQSATHLVRDTQ